MLGTIRFSVTSSPFGFASILVAAAIICGCILALNLELSTVGTDPNENHFAEALLVISVFAETALLSSLSSLLGIALSMASLARSERKFFGVVGLALNGAIVSVAALFFVNVFG